MRLGPWQLETMQGFKYEVQPADGHTKRYVLLVYPYTDVLGHIVTRRDFDG